ncbi:hypothetical protein WA026_011061 [Henosepilachna vigintioctopunctata]|uniref:Uncharacterized protein n=1 Tax=Henosepilachna vigintioctopunctata TaxID=420089 RepID=A0AAW1TZ75_9CUCU
MVQDLLNRGLKATNDMEMQVSVLCLLMLKYYPEESYKEILAKCSSSEERLEVYLKAIEGFEPADVDYKRTEAIALYVRIKESFNYEQSYEAIKAPSILFKPLHPLYQSSLSENYNLSTVCSNFQGVTYIEGNHISILESRILAEEIEKFITNNQRVEISSYNNERK